MATDSKTRLLRDAERFVLQGKISQAITEYLKIVRDEPEDVLVLNTIGDLYLRLGRVGEANKLFHQVAENYLRNNFLLKAVAVFKKILASEPSNLELNTTIAELYARQGMNVDARHQYLRVAEMCATQGRLRDCAQAYEKVVELDPMNASVQLKLADIHAQEANTEKVVFYRLGAARALAKTGDHQEAVRAYRRVVDLDPKNIEALRGLMESALQLGDANVVKEQLGQALREIPQDASLRELAGRAFLSVGDVERAVTYFDSVLEADNSRYENYLLVSRHLLESGDIDRSCRILDPIIPIAVSRREPESLVRGFELILDKAPDHAETLKKLTDLFSAINDGARYLNSLERLADHYINHDQPVGGLECLAKILELSPDSDDYRRMHRELFAQLYPDKPYTPPVEVESIAAPEQRSAPEAAVVPADDNEGAANPALIEIDLLLNYGMKEKALQQLQELAAQDPFDKQVRLRLASVYREVENNEAAAEQCLLLAALYRKSGKEDSVARHLAEARKLAPGLAGEDFELRSFAAKHGIQLEDPKSKSRPRVLEEGSVMELDLTGDLSEIFFQDGDGETGIEELGAEQPESSVMVEDLAASLPKPAKASLQEQLQEVDFYLRLGFSEEAKAKLAEISREHPDHPELTSRYQQLGEPGDGSQYPPSDQSHEPPISPGVAETSAGDSFFLTETAPLEETEPPEDPPQVIALAGGPAAEDSPGLKAAEKVQASEEQPAADTGAIQTEVLREIEAEIGVNQMFTDLIQEVNTLTELEIAREDFETHFNLGIAYREMSLVDDAIREFQSAVKALKPTESQREAVRCCGMLSLCYLEKDMPRSAIRWCQTGLGLPHISGHERLALQYDMAVAFALTGDNDQALECFNRIFAADPSYRDVAQRIDGLRASHVQHAPPDLA